MARAEVLEYGYTISITHVITTVIILYRSDDDKQQHLSYCNTLYSYMKGKISM